MPLFGETPIIGGVPIPIGQIGGIGTGGGPGFLGFDLEGFGRPTVPPNIPFPTLGTLPGTRGNPIPQTGGPIVGGDITLSNLIPILIELLKLIFGGGGGGRAPTPTAPQPSPPIFRQPQPVPVPPGGGAGGGIGGPDVPFLSLEGGGLFGTGVTGGDIASIIGAIRGGNGGNVAMPGGASLTGLGGGGLDVPFIDIVPQGQGSACGTPFRVNACGNATPQKHLKLNPKTGKATWFGPLGEPVLFSRDLATVKRVKKIAGRARRSVGGR